MIRGSRLGVRYVEAGQRLIRLLDEANIDVRAALWMYSADESVWRLVVALPDAIKRGPLAVYTEVQGVFRSRAMDLAPLGLHDVTIKDAAEKFFSDLREMPDTKPEPGTSVELGERIIDGMLIDDAIVYRAT